MKVDASKILEVCKSSNSMAEAHRKLGQLKFATFSKYAKHLGCYKPNTGRKGCPRQNARKDHSHYTEFGNFITSHKLKLLLIRDGIKNHECEICKLTEWNGQPIPLELDHIDGEHYNNKLDNLRIICPNCHAQTPTHAGKKNKKARLSQLVEEIALEAI